MYHQFYSRLAHSIPAIVVSVDLHLALKHRLHTARSLLRLQSLRPPLAVHRIACSLLRSLDPSLGRTATAPTERRGRRPTRRLLTRSRRPIPWSCGHSSSASSSVEWWQRTKVSETGDKRRHTVLGWWRSRGRSAVMMVREWSELLAGSRWNTFIRRLKGNPRHSCDVMRMVKSSSFQYSPLSYALNFDEGHGGSSEGYCTGYRDFSSRFVVAPPPCKSSVDLSGRNALPVFSSSPPLPAAVAVEVGDRVRRGVSRN